MSQIQIPQTAQTQIETSQSKLNIELFTWGSCRRGYGEIVYPEKIDLRYVTGRHGKHTVELPYATIVYDNSDSRKNIHRSVTIIPKAKIVVRYYGARSCNPNSHFNDIYILEPGKEPIKVTEIQSRTMTYEYGKYTITKNIEYICVDNNEIVVAEYEVERKKTKLTIYVKRNKDLIEIFGDTYEIRSQLKAHGFSWDADRKRWIGKQLPPLPENIEIIEVPEQ